MAGALELVLLGTSSPIHSPHRFGAAQVIVSGEAVVLIDCGWGATLRLYQAGIRLPKIRAIFFTHLHSDHTTDFADFLVMRWVGGIDEPLAVYGPEGTAGMVEGFRQALAADTRFRLAHHGEKLSSIGTACETTEIVATETPAEVATIDDLSISVFAVDHRPVIPAFGYRVERDGRVITISGDTNPCPGLVNGARDADLLVCDAMNRRMMNELQETLRGAGNSLQAELLADAHEYHASVEDAAEVAKAAGAKRLVLSHVMPPVPNEGPQAEAFVSGLDSIFGGEITIGHDLQRFAIA